MSSLCRHVPCVETERRQLLQLLHHTVYNQSKSVSPHRERPSTFRGCPTGRVSELACSLFLGEYSDPYASDRSYFIFLFGSWWEALIDAIEQRPMGRNSNGLNRNLAFCFTAADPLFFFTSAVRYELKMGFSIDHLTAYPSSTLRNESSLLAL